MKIIIGDITQMDTDAIINAAAPDLKPRPGICEAVFAAADTVKLKEECEKIGKCEVGKAVVTPSCGLPCKYIVHVAGTGWFGINKDQLAMLEKCYKQGLQKAHAKRCRSIAVPLIFSGEYFVPRSQSLRVAIKAIGEFENDHPGIDVRLVLYKRSIYEAALRILKHQNEHPDKY